MKLDGLKSLIRPLALASAVAVILLAVTAPGGIVFAQEEKAEPAPTLDVAKPAPDELEGECVGFARLDLPEVPEGAEAPAKVMDTHCGTFTSSGSYFFYYNSYSSYYGYCYEGTVTMTSGDSDLYLYYDSTWNSNTVPPSSAGTFLCSSTHTGTTTDYCNACTSVYPYCWMGYGVLRAYAYCYSAPSSYCLTATLWICYDVKLTKAESRRDGATMEVVWEATDDSTAAGYVLYRRYAPDEEWVRVTERMIPADASRSYRVVETLPADTGDVYYRLDEVGLDGNATHVANITDHDHRTLAEKGQ